MTPEELHHLLREAQLEVAEIVVSRCESRIGALRPAIGMTISARAQRLLDSSDDRISSDDRDFLHEIAADFAL